jgi:hypothetical protein
MYCNLHMQNFSYNINIDHLPPMRWYKVHTYKCVKSLKCVPKLTMQYSYWQIFICRICHRNFKDFPYFQNGHYSNCTFQSGTIHLNIVVAFSIVCCFSISLVRCCIYILYLSKKSPMFLYYPSMSVRFPRQILKISIYVFLYFFIKCFSLPYKMEKFAMAKDDFYMQKWNFSLSRLFL